MRGFRRGAQAGMAGVDTRNLTRESLIMMADMRVENVIAKYRVKVRNLSPGGMMGAGEARVVRGSRVTVTLRGLEPVKGTIAWMEGDRFGVAFDVEVDCEYAKQVYLNNGDDRSVESAIVERPGGSPALNKYRTI